MLHQQSIESITVASCIGGSDTSCHAGPPIIRDSEFSQLLQPSINLRWHPQIEPDQHLKNSLAELSSLSRKLAAFSSQQFTRERPFLVIGGDHSCAIGTWAGVINQLQNQHRFALLWIDAHLDAHTLKTSPTGNLHGMPVSAITGHADSELSSCYPVQQFMKPEHLFYFGIRSYEPDELALVTKIHANILTMRDIQVSGGIENSLNTLLTHIDQNYSHFGISIDLDAIDPIQAPGVETPCADGLDASRLMQTLHNFIPRQKLVGVEITEFNPQADRDQVTEKLVYGLINSIFTATAHTGF